VADPDQLAGMNIAPQGKPGPAVKPGEFIFAAAHLDHGHIFGQCGGLVEAGATLKWIYDPDPAKVALLLKNHPEAKTARSINEILDDPEVRMVTAAAVPCDRGPLGCRVMESGKDYFTDKGPFTSLEQLDQARETANRTGRKYMVYYSERLHSECSVFAGELIHGGVIGRVIQVLGLGPHRLNAPNRPAWFFDTAKYGGILCDIGSHQVEQFLRYSGAKNATVNYAAVGNFNNPDHPGLEDFGEASLLADNGASNYFRIDWFTPGGLRTWGDGRTVILGTKGYIELRKYIDVGRESNQGDNLVIVNEEGEKFLNVTGQVGFPFFGELILDSLNRTETAMTQEHAFKAAELCLLAQQAAVKLPG
jgi:predicted dehydrogenase